MTAELFSSLLTGLLPASAVTAVAAYFAKRWVERVEAASERLAVRMETLIDRVTARLDQLERDSRSCSVDFMSRFCTKEELVEHKSQERDQWTKLEDLSRQVAVLETAHRMNHDS